MKKLYLLPNVLHEDSTWSYDIPAIDALIAESEKGGRLFLKRFHHNICPIYTLNEHTKNLHQLLSISEDMVGLVSDAGLPCLADPGSELVSLAHHHRIEVETLPGPSSIFMALQLSGFSGQRFTFHGYFPRDEKELQQALRKLTPFYTHIFIETPYRTQKLISLLTKHLSKESSLCVAADLMSPTAWVRSDPIKEWVKTPSLLDKKRAVFLIKMLP